MRKIAIEKVTINMGCGDDEKLIERSKKLISMLTGKTPVVTLSKKRSTFGVPKNKPIGVKATLRGNDAIEFLKLAFGGVENRIKDSQFDSEGNFSFGVKEYIEMPGIKYNHEIGMLGFDVAVTLKRAGFGISKRRIQKRKIPLNHKIKREESVDWVKKNFGVDIV